jgi:hypothetical protein
MADYEADPYLKTSIAAQNKFTEVLEAARAKRASLTNVNYNPVATEVNENAISRGLYSVGSAVRQTRNILTGDEAAIAEQQLIDSIYRRDNPSSQAAQELYKAYTSASRPEEQNTLANSFNEAGRGIENVGKKIVDDGWGKLLDNISALAGGVATQLPNMVIPLATTVAGGALGSLAGPVGTGAGAVAGATLGNSIVGSTEAISESLNEAGINPADRKAVQEHFSNKDTINDVIKKDIIKSAIIGVVDVATLKLGGAALAKPVELATERALVKLGIDVTDKIAVNKAIKTGAVKELVEADPLYNAAIKRANIGVGVSEFAGEGVGEGLGTYGAYDKIDVPSAVLESFSSAGQSGATYAGQKLYAEATSPLKTKQEENQRKQLNQDALAETASKTGNVGDLANPQSEAYNPAVAVASLIKNSQLDTATDNIKEANREKALGIIDGLEGEIFSLNNLIADKDTLTSTIQRAEAKKATLDPSDPMVQGLDTIIAQQTQLLNQPERPTSEIKQIKTRIAKLDKELTNANQAFETFEAIVTGKRSTEDIITEANKPVSVDTPADTGSVDKVISLAMRSPDTFSSEEGRAQLQAIVDNPSNAATPEQRNYFKEFISAKAAEAAAKKLDQVNKDIFFGSDKSSTEKYIGINQYRENVNKALSKGNEGKAKNELAKLVRFAEAHAQKLSIAKAAKQKVEDSIQKQQRRNFSIAATENGEWELIEQKISNPPGSTNKEKLNAINTVTGKNYNRYITINGKSDTLIEAIESEVTALNAAVKEMKTGIDYVSTKKPKKDNTITKPETKTTEETPAKEVKEDKPVSKTPTEVKKDESISNKTEAPREKTKEKENTEPTTGASTRSDRSVGQSKVAEETVQETEGTGRIEFNARRLKALDEVSLVREEDVPTEVDGYIETVIKSVKVTDLINAFNKKVDEINAAIKCVKAS